MTDDRRDEEKKQELMRIEEGLRQGRLSRRIFLDRMKGIGIGFGAAFILGVKATEAQAAPQAGVSVSSTNPALDDILAEAQEDMAADGELDADSVSAQRRRYYRRFYRRYGRFYRRGYRRYARFYRRGYRRYARYYRRW